MTHRMIARLDNAGDVLLAGPAVRAVAASSERTSFLAGPAGAAAARLLPHVDTVMVHDAPWVSFHPRPVDKQATDQFIDEVARERVDEAVILTSFHQSPLPLALLLRLAGVQRIVATCVDYPGSLLDVRHPFLDDLHEVEQSLSLCRAAGFELPPGDAGELRVMREPRPATSASGAYVVIQPGASVPARALPAGVTSEVVDALVERGIGVRITGTTSEGPLARAIAGSTGRATDLTGTTDLADLIELIGDADAVVCGNSLAAHVAAAVGTPVVQAFAPVVPAHRWHPWKVPYVALGEQDIACAGCRARVCPVPGQPCLEPVTASAVLAALADLAPGLGLGLTEPVGVRSR